ncbi:hypothetical protein [Vibrio brasiliensis]|uniref:TMhelix containing protein n=1 Tax=Vibrio brasiliensis LMG 20546 TaxID=945543 RepID=E8LW52_9VIBR|nr:hypothetical protein [Vibrio brasiliensis]EGA65106.1 hypothetical protein VIBR0546_09177 [Vibrio brasiliensis LMG 20546]
MAIPIITLITGGFSLAKSWVQGKAEAVKEKSITAREAVQAKRDENKQRESNLAKGERSMAELDAITLKQIGWLDDFVIISIWAVVWSCFIPDLQPYAVAGVKSLATMPVWFQYVVAASIIYTLGFKSLVYRLLVKRGF